MWTRETIDAGTRGSTCSRCCPTSAEASRSASPLGLVWTVGKIAIPQLTRHAIDSGIERGGSVVIWAVLIGCAGLMTGTFTALRRYFAFRESRWTETRLRERLFDHIMWLHIGYHDRAQTGQLMSRSSSDLNQIQAFVVMIPITISNLALDRRRRGDPVPHRSVAGARGAGAAPVRQRHRPSGSRRRSTRRCSRCRPSRPSSPPSSRRRSAACGSIKGFGAERVQSDKLRTEADDIQRVVDQGGARPGEVPPGDRPAPAARADRRARHRRHRRCSTAD